MKSVCQIISFFSLLLLTVGCVSTQKTLYLQDAVPDEVVSQQEKLQKRFKISPYQHKLKSGDVISLEVMSVTQGQLNIFNRNAPVITPGAAGTAVAQTARPAATSQNANSAGYLIEEEGTIEMPVIGKVAIANLTIKEAQDKVKGLLGDYLKDPTVEIRLLNFNFTILGEVKAEGIFNSPNPKINILEALGNAGGMTDFADRSTVRVIRHEEGAAKVHYINLLEDNVIQSENYYVRPGDIIIVNPLKAKNTRQYQLTNAGFGVSILATLAALASILLR